MSAHDLNTEKQENDMMSYYNKFNILKKIN